MLDRGMPRNTNFSMKEILALYRLFKDGRLTEEMWNLFKIAYETGWGQQSDGDERGSTEGFSGFNWDALERRNWSRSGSRSTSEANSRATTPTSAVGTPSRTSAISSISMTKGELRKCRRETEKWLDGNIETWKKTGTIPAELDIENKSLVEKIQTCSHFLPKVVVDALSMMTDAGDIGHDQQLYTRYNNGDTIPLSKNIFRACTILGIGMARITGGRTADLCGLGECDGFWTKPTEMNVGERLQVTASQLSSNYTQVASDRRTASDYSTLHSHSRVVAPTPTRRSTSLAVPNRGGAWSADFNSVERTVSSGGSTTASNRHGRLTSNQGKAQRTKSQARSNHHEAGCTAKSEPTIC